MLPPDKVYRRGKAAWQPRRKKIYNRNPSVRRNRGHRIAYFARRNSRVDSSPPKNIGNIQSYERATCQSVEIYIGQKYRMDPRLGKYFF